MDDKASDKAEEKAEDKVKDESKADGDSEVKDESKIDGDSKAGGSPEPEAKAAGLTPTSDLTPKVAMAAVAPPSSSKSKKGIHKAELSIFDLAVGVFLLVILSQLVANSYVAYLGRSYNDRVCAESIALAGEAANRGEDTPHVHLAAFKSWEHCASPGFFIEHPELISFKDDIDPVQKLRVITICSSTRVRVPVPFLVMDKSGIEDSGGFDVFPQFTFRKTYQYQLKNPKGIEGKWIKDSSGKIIARPPKAVKGGTKGAPAVKTGAPPANADVKPASTTGTESSPQANPNKDP